ncbi:flagellar biosynthesis anti-sigma factor FlgM [Anaerocolumna xylanovorans]|uniref:Negative regulator of flagellin synthesis n=1 Tax=Anaerocolumna xylanovorans DSM 12503 TaxID=1121345 RepID=A0A1M7Y7Y6_9FIRM|nr:flagellar biosynthesis anti-sigma factor FlgM [Anaerocolumna xylanovorans]SHO48729.1 anti-sigma-28 factor, FlgM family [Anaerocolumna xylanovorans DSM 12503]
MRIDAYNKISQVYQANSTQKVAKTVSVSGKDKLEISSTAKDYQAVKQVLGQIPDVREDKVKAIKTQMQSGTYNVNMEEVASHIVDSYFEKTI